MTKQFLLFFAFCVALNTIASAEFRHDRKILAPQFKSFAVKDNDLKEIQRKLRENVLHQLRELPDDIKSNLTKRAENEYKNGSYPQLKAWDFLEFTRDGDRGHYETKLNKRNQRLSILVIGHLLDVIDNSSSTLYVDEIFNGAWMILEDSTWTWPAHIHHLPAPNEIVIDLGAGEMAKHISWIHLLMKDKFNELKSAKMNSRISFELEKRIFGPYLEKNWSWSGLNHTNASVNNWNVWINGNILKSAIYTLENATLFKQIFDRTLESVDVFLSNYGDDGGCDEGPSYWRQAGGRLIEFIQAVCLINPEAVKYFRQQPLIKAIGEYSWKMRITGHWFVNFADSVPPIVYPPSLVYQYGQLFDDDRLRHYAAFLHDEHDPEYRLNSESKEINEFINYIQVRKQLIEIKPIAPEPEIVTLPDLQVAVVRSKPESRNLSKLFVAAKMGTNYESHNHNDVGNYVFFQNGFPVLIDIGVGTYTAKTFGPQRYSLFYMQSKYHNCPSINGYEQHQGVPYHAINVTLDQQADNSSLTLQGDLSKAYPTDAKIHHWSRKIHFDRNANELTVEEDYKLEKFLNNSQLHFVTVSSMKLDHKDDGLLLNNGDVSVIMQFDWNLFDFQSEIKSLENDHHLTSVWGENVQRFTLTLKSQSESGSFKILFKPGTVTPTESSTFENYF